MRTALEWIEAESAKQNPETQDIAPWMETSMVGSIPVPTLASTRPPTHVSSSHPAGKILSTSGVRPIPVEPIVIELGLDLSHVVQCRAYLTEFERDYAAFNDTYQSYFPADRRPARTTVGVTALAVGALVEVDCVARRP